MRVLEIGCGPGVAAREIAGRIGNGFVLAIDRSDKAISTARRQSVAEIKAGRLDFRVSTIEAFEIGVDDMNRREFLATAGSAVAAQSLRGRAAMADPIERKVLWAATVRNKSLDDRIRAARAGGFDAMILR